MKAVALMLMAILPDQSHPVAFINYEGAGVPIWYPSYETCAEGQAALLNALETGEFLPGLSTVYKQVYAWCLQLPLDGLPFLPGAY